MYICTYEWHLLSLRRENGVLFFRMPSSLFFFFLHWPGAYAERVQNMQFFFGNIFLFLLKFMCEAQEKQVENYVIFKLVSVSQ